MELKNKAAALSFALLVALAAYFFVASRYPDLNLKDKKGTRVSAENPISFTQWLPLTAQDKTPARIVKIAANWSYDNRKGMTFGVLFGGALLTFLSTLSLRRLRRRGLQGAIVGLLFGAPLGVCANCVAPIGKSLSDQKFSLSSVLAVMHSSPMLNIVAILMVLHLFPLDLAFLMIGVSLLYVLLVVPLVARISHSPLEDNQFDLPEAKLSASSWTGACMETAIALWKNTLQIAITTVPLMIVAGLAGAFMAEIIPFEKLYALAANPFNFTVLAALFLFLPVPMTFNVVAAFGLYSAGVSISAVVLAYFALGIFSIYPLLILWKYVSKRAAVVNAICLFLFSILASQAVAKTYLSLRERAQSQLLTGLQEIANGSDLAESIKRSCHEFPPRLYSVCLEKFISRRILADTPDSGRICKVYDETDKQARCIREMNIRKAALDLPPTCAALPELDRPSCETSVKRNLAESMRDPRLCAANDTKCADIAKMFHARDLRQVELCKEVSDPQLRSACNQRIIIEIGYQQDQFRACQNLLAAEQEFCVERFAREIFRFGGDASACSPLKGELKEVCLAQKDILQALVSPEGAAACRNFTPKVRISCTQAFVDQLQSPELCLQVTDKDARENCIQSAASRFPAEVLSSKLCERLPEQKQDLCYFSLMESSASELSRRLVYYNVVKDKTLASSELQKTNDAVFPPRKIAPLNLQPFYKTNDLEISSRPFTKAQTRSNTFVTHWAKDLGINKQPVFRPADFHEPFAWGRGLAADDFDQDGRPDVALATEKGIYLYRNIGNLQFEEVSGAGLEATRSLDSFGVAFVDIENDGWLDLVITTLGDGIYIVPNKKGAFTDEKLIHIPYHDGILATALAFADVDHSGRLSFFEGQWFQGQKHDGSKLYLNRGEGRWELSTMTIQQGSSHTALFSDLNEDGWQDLFVGNDFAPPDGYYLSNASGELVAANKNIFPVTPRSTMSIDSGDLNGDGHLDLFSLDMPATGESDSRPCEHINDSEGRRRCMSNTAIFRSMGERQVDSCKTLEDPMDRASCLVGILLRIVEETQDKKLCENIPEAFKSHRTLCNLFASTLTLRNGGVQRANRGIINGLPQQQTNILLLQQADGTFKSAEQSWGAAQTSWSWNAKMHDLDNDGDLDVYVATGVLGYANGSVIGYPNYLLENIDNKRFAKSQVAWGLGDSLTTTAYVVADFDDDGDLDILANGVNAPYRLYENQKATGNSVAISLRQAHHNSFCVGCRITAKDAKGHIYVREVKSGGGHLSFDPTTQMIGLGKNKEITELQIIWSDGSKSELRYPLPAGQLYQIRKNDLR